MTGGSARVGIVPALVVAMAVAANAAAADRFVPTNPDFVVASVRQAVPDAGLRGLIADWRRNPTDSSRVALASAFLEHARALREPMYVGRAEAVLADAAKRPQASADTRRLYAQTLQYRHAFPAAETMLDGILRDAPFDPAARTQRASVRLVRGEFDAARGDCARLLGGGGSRSIALACLAESLAGGGRLEQARALLAAYPAPEREDPAARAYLLTLRAELDERAGSPERAIAGYAAALTLAPRDDSIRAALADALIAQDRTDEARGLLDIERPSLALLVRRAACTRGDEQQRARAQARSWLDLEAARGDAPHLREAAMLYLSLGDARRALEAADRNFSLQKQLADVRVLARSAIAAGDAAARGRLVDWLHATGFRDSVAESILHAPARG